MGDATAKGTLWRRLRLDHAIQLDRAVLPLHAEPPLLMTATVKDGEGVPAQSERTESFELVTPLSINAVNGDGGTDRIGAHA